MKSEMNLLPVNLPENRKKPIKKMALTMVWGIVLIILLGSYIILVYLDQSCLNQINAVEAEQKNWNGVEVARESLSDRNEAAKQRESILVVISRDKDIPVQTLIEVQKALPIGMSVNGLTYSEKSITIRAETKKREDILVFKDQLSKCGLFDQIQIISSDKKTFESTETNQMNEDTWEFTLEIGKIKAGKNE